MNETMLSRLTRFESQLSGLLPDLSGWKGDAYTFKESTVFRTERRWEDCYARLNCFLPDPSNAGRDYAVLHPHRWRGAFRIVEGGYDMDFAYAADEKAANPQFVSELFLPAGSMYTMEDSRLWHTVRKSLKTYTICLCGPDFSEEEVNQIALSRPNINEGRSHLKRRSMTSEEMQKHLDVYKKYYLPG